MFHSMSVQCWHTVCDAGPTLYQHLVNISCLIGDTRIHVLAAGPTLYQHLVNISCLIGDTRIHVLAAVQQTEDTDSMLG